MTTAFPPRASLARAARPRRARRKASSWRIARSEWISRTRSESRPKQLPLHAQFHRPRHRRDPLPGAASGAGYLPEAHRANADGKPAFRAHSHQRRERTEPGEIRAGDAADRHAATRDGKTERRHIPAWTHRAESPG